MRATALTNYQTMLTACPPTGSQRLHRWLAEMANWARWASVSWDQWALDVCTNASRPVSATELREAWKASRSSARAVLSGRDALTLNQFREALTNRPKSGSGRRLGIPEVEGGTR